MCFGNRVLCKRCKKETISYREKCDQWPEVKIETPTHGIRGRHRRIMSCKDCNRHHQRLDEARSRFNVRNYPRAKATLEFLRRERPLPLEDEGIADRYYDLFMQNRRLHPYCIGFTDIHTEKIEDFKDDLKNRADKIVEACMKLEGDTHPEIDLAVGYILQEATMFRECLRRQAEIDSGIRTLDQSDQVYSRHRIGATQCFIDAMRLITEEIRKYNDLSFASFTADIDSRFINENRLRTEILRYTRELEGRFMHNEVDYRFIVNFQFLVDELHDLDEVTFDFDPDTHHVPGDAHAYAQINGAPHMTFRQWAGQYEAQNRIPSQPPFGRWYHLTDGYREYLSQNTRGHVWARFCALRNSIAVEAFRELVARSEPWIPSPSSSQGGDVASWLALTSDSDSSDVWDLAREQREEIIMYSNTMQDLVRTSGRLLHSLGRQVNHVSSMLAPSIEFLRLQLEVSVSPTDDEYEVIDGWVNQAMAVNRELEIELRDRRREEARIAQEAELQAESESETETRSRDESPKPASEPESESHQDQPSEHFYIDLTPTPVVFVEMEPEADNTSHGRRIFGDMRSQPQPQPSPPSSPTEEGEMEWEAEEFDDFAWVDEISQRWD